MATITATNVNVTDTFEIWRSQTNAIITDLNSINDDYAPKNNVLTLDNSAQTVSGRKIFASGLTVGSVTLSGTTTLLINGDVSITDGKSLTATKLINSSGTVSINGIEYQFPSTPADGYLFFDNNSESSTYSGSLNFTPISSLADSIAQLLGERDLITTQEITPIGTVIAVDDADGISTTNTLWLLCDGATKNKVDYPDLAAALGETGTTFNLPDIPNDSIGDATVSYYIKALKENVTIFSLSHGNGLTLVNENSVVSSTIGIKGGRIQLNLGNEFIASPALTLASNAVDYTKLKNATTTTLPLAVSIPLRTSSGYLYANTPSGDDPKALTNKAYVDQTVTAHSSALVTSLNSCGYNSYQTFPSHATCLVESSGNSYMYGSNDGSAHKYRFGNFSGNSYGNGFPKVNTNVVKLYVDDWNTYALFENGEVKSLGYNTNKKSGASTSGDILAGPRAAFNNASNIAEVVLSYDKDARTAYAVTTNNNLYVTGDNTYGQLGTGDLISGGPHYNSGYATWRLQNKVQKAWLIGGGTTQTGYVLTTDGEVWACGYNGYGQLGRKTNTENTKIWKPVLRASSDRTVGGTVTKDAGTNIYTRSSHGLSDFDRVKIGTDYYTINWLTSDTFSLHSNDDITTARISSLTATDVKNGEVYTRLTGVTVAAFGGVDNKTSGYAISGNRLYSWGNNDFGQLGQNDTNSKYAANLADSLSGIDVTNIYTGLDNAVHVKRSNGKLYAAGYNGKGALGAGDTNNKTGFVIVNSAKNVHKFFSSGSNIRFCVFKDSGENYELTAWGNNENNNLGIDIGSATVTSPQTVYISTPKNVSQVCTSNIRDNNMLTQLLIINDGQTAGDVYTCGYHYYGVNSYPNEAKTPFFTLVKNR